MNTTDRTHPAALRALAAACTLILAASAARAQSPAAPAKADAPQQLEKFEVTGSRIKRLDAETTSPVITYTAQSIEQRGYDNLGEFVQSLPFNTGSANSVFQAGSFTRAAVTANPRGLGSNRFLTLVNGRRAVSYALTQGANTSIFDFSAIPNAAVSADYLGEYFNAGFATPGWGENQVTVVNPSLTYRGPWKTTIRVGVNNVFGREPPINGYTSSGFDQSTYGENVAAGRMFYVDLKKSF